MTERWLLLLHTLTGRLLGEKSYRTDPSPLLEDLAADGWEPVEIALALAWVERFFSGLGRRQSGPCEPIASTGHRTRSAEEFFCVTARAFGYLLRLESAGVIDAALREEILDRALAVCEDEVGEAEIREISRMVLETQGRDGSAADEPDPGRARNRHMH
jgi:Smg protein